jgi:hypothetical protein
VIKVITSLGTLQLCLDSDNFTIGSVGFVLSKPGFSFMAIKKTGLCNHLRVSLLFYPFDLCFIPLHHPKQITYRVGNRYETITLEP